MSILIIDDDEEVLNCLGKAVETLGHRPVLMTSARAACGMIPRGGFSLILVDLKMPDMSGLEVLAFARKADPLAVGIMVTGHPSGDSVFAALKEGAYDYLVKPASLPAIQASVRRALEHYELKRSLLQQGDQLEAVRKEFRDTVLRIDDMAHKLKEPLSVVFGYASYLEEQASLPHQPGEFRKGIRAIQQSANCMKDLINRLSESVWASPRAPSPDAP